MGLAGYIGLQVVLPALLPPLLRGMAAGLQALAWMPLALFGGCAAVSLGRSLINRASAGTAARATHASRTGPASPPMPSTPPSGLSWGRSAMQNPGQKIGDERIPIERWTVDALRELEWKRFELVCARYYELAGFRTQTLRCGPDGGIDIRLFRADPAQPLAIVQCKAWNSSRVGVAPVRELLGVMAAEKIGRGIFATTSTFTEEARRFAEGNPIQLLDGPDLIDKIGALPDAARLSLLRFAFDGDYATPTCPSCGIKTVIVDGRKGAFWGCSHYPRCKTHFPLRKRAT
ncbi:MAG: restriction endonuclease [Burkholderiaceae bacterium]